MGVIKSQIASLAGSSKFGPAAYGETIATTHASSATPKTLLAAPAAGKVRRVGIGNTCDGAGRFFVPNSEAQLTEFKLGAYTFYSNDMGTGGYDTIPRIIVPSGLALTATLSQDVEVDFAFSWAEHDDSDFGCVITELTGTSWVTVLGPAPSGKIYVPIESAYGSISMIFNGDTVDHGYDIELYDGVTEYPLYTGGSFSGREDLYNAMTPPIHGDLVYRVRLAEAVDTINPVAFMCFAIIDEA